MAEQKHNLTEKDIQDLRTVIRQLANSDSPDINEFLSAVRDGLDTQSKNFSGLLKAMQHGFTDFKKSGRAMSNVFKDLASQQNFNVKNIVDILSKNKALSSGSDIKELERVLTKEISQNKKLKFELNADADYIKITKLIQSLDSLKKNIGDNQDAIADNLQGNADLIDDTLSLLSAFHNQLERMSSDFKEHGLLTDIISVNISDSKEAINEIIGLSAKYTDILSNTEIPSLSVDNIISEFNALREEIGGDSFDIFGNVGLSFKEASANMMSAFNSELDNLNEQIQEINSNIVSGLLAVDGFTLEQDKDGNEQLTRMGLPISDQTISNDIISNAEKLAEQFNIMADYNALILTSSGDQRELDKNRLKFAAGLVEHMIEAGHLTKDEIKNDKDRLEFMDNYIQKIEDEMKNLNEKEKLLFFIHTSAQATLKLQEKQIKLSKAELNIMDKYKSTIDSIYDMQQHITDQLQYTLTQMPLWTQNLLGTDKVLEKINKSAEVAFQTMTEKLLDKDNPASYFEALTSYANAFGKNLIGAVSPLKLLAVGLIGAAVLAYNLMNRVKDLSTELGISKGEAFQLYDNMLKMEGAAGNIAVTQEKILELQSAHLEKYGRLIDLSTKEGKSLVETASLMSSAYGVATTEASGMISIFKQIGANDGLAKNLAMSTLEAAKLAKISPKIIAKDLIDGAEEVSMYFGNMPEQAASAAVNIRRMGSNIKKVGEQMQSTWNIESFMTNMYEVAQLTGTGINLSAVFDAGIQGDAEKFQESLLDALGSLDELNNYSPQAQKKIAETIGMSVGEMKNMLRMSEMSLDLTKEEQSALNNHLSTLGDISAFTKEDLEARAKEFAATEAMDASWNKIKATLTRAILPVIEIISDILTALSPVIDLIGFGFKAIGLLIKPFIPFMKFLSDGLMMISGFITNIFQGIDSGIDSVEGLGSKLSDVVKILGSGLLTVGLFSGKLKGLLGGIGNIAMSPIKMILGKGQIADMASEKKQSIFESIKSKVFNKASETSTTETKSFDIKSVIGDKLESAKNFVSDSIDNIKGIIKNGLTFIKDTAVQLADAIMEPLKTIAAGTGDIISKILNGISSGLNSFSPKAIIGAAALTILSGALWISAKAFKEFNSVDWDSIGKGIIGISAMTGVALLLGGASAQMILGAVAIGALGVALIPLAYGLSMFNEIDWASIGKGIVALTSFSLIAAGLSVAAPAIFVGSLAIGALGASLVVMGAGISVLSTGLTDLSSVTEQIIPMISQLTSINPVNLFGIATGIAALSVALGALTLSNAFSGFASLFDGDPFKKISDLAQSASGITELANSFSLLVSSIRDYMSISGDLSFEPLTKLNENRSVSEAIIPLNKNISELATESSEKIKTNETTNYNTTAQTSNSNQKLEMLMQQVVALLTDISVRPIPAVIGTDQVPNLAKKIKQINNR